MERTAMPDFDVQHVLSRVDAMRTQARARDEKARLVKAMRENDYDSVAPGLLPDGLPGALVANLIDTAAHDLSEVMAPLPTVSCASSSVVSDSKKQFQNKRSLIANSYVQHSRLSDQMYMGADRYLTYGYMVYMVEPDWDGMAPDVRISDSDHSYWVTNHRDQIVQFADVMKIPVEQLCAIFPERAHTLRTQAQNGGGVKEFTVVEWYDRYRRCVIVEETKDVLAETPNVLSSVPIRVVKRPDLNRRGVSGQFDDVVWVQVARALMAAYTLNAVDKSVNAPIAVPSDVQTMEVGPDSVITTDNPQQVGRVRLDVPQGLFPEQAALAQEQRIGSRYPEGRSGNIDASVITGQGVQALMGTFDTQIQTFHRLNESALEDVLSLCFEMDQKLWPDLDRSVRVRDAGSPVEISYKPNKDIKSDFSVNVSYGAVAGLDPNRSLIFLLQAVSGGFMSRETARRYMPVDVDQVKETELMDLEAVRESMLASVASMAQAIPAMAANGQDPRQIVTQLAEVIRLREKGKTIDQAVSEVFAPKQDEQAQQPAQPDPLAALMGGGGDPAAAAAGGGVPIEGPPSPGQDLLMGLAGLTPSGNSNLQMNLSTRATAR